MNREQTKKVWMLFDGRYRTDEDRATCYEVCESLREAKNSAKDYGNDTVIVEGDLKGSIIENSRIIN